MHGDEVDGDRPPGPVQGGTAPEPRARGQSAVPPWTRTACRAPRASERGHEAYDFAIW